MCRVDNLLWRVQIPKTSHSGNTADLTVVTIPRLLSWLGSWQWLTGDEGGMGQSGIGWNGLRTFEEILQNIRMTTSWWVAYDLISFESCEDFLVLGLVWFGVNDWVFFFSPVPASQLSPMPGFLAEALKPTNSRINIIKRGVQGFRNLWHIMWDCFYIWWQRPHALWKLSTEHNSTRDYKSKGSISWMLIGIRRLKRNLMANERER